MSPFVALFTDYPELARSYASILVSGNHSSVVFTELADLLIAEIADALIRSGRSTASSARPLAEASYFAYLGRLFTWSPSADADADALARSLRSTLTAIYANQETDA